MAEEIERVTTKRIAIQITEISAATSLAAFICGVVYDASFFLPLNPRLFHLLSIHDHINLAISYIPQTIFFAVLAAGLGQLLPGTVGINIRTIVAYYTLQRFPKLLHRVVTRNIIKKAAMKVTEDLQRQYQIEHPDEYNSTSEKKRGELTALLMFLLVLLTLLILTLRFFIGGIWSVFMAILAAGWCGVAILLINLIFKLAFSTEVLIMISVLLSVVTQTSVQGFLDAATLPRVKEPLATVYVEGSKPDSTSILVRVLDSGPLLYDQSSRHFQYYPWSKIVRLEVVSR